MRMPGDMFKLFDWVICKYWEADGKYARANVSCRCNCESPECDFFCRVRDGCLRQSCHTMNELACNIC